MFCHGIQPFTKLGNIFIKNITLLIQKSHFGSRFLDHTWDDLFKRVILTSFELTPTKSHFDYQYGVISK